MVSAPTELLATLLGLLADVIRRDACTLHPWQPFPEIGLDSLLGTEFVATVNARFGTAIKGAAVLDHPCLEAFALHVAREARCVAGPAPLVAPALPPCRPLPSADELREELAQVLACDPWDLDPCTPFSDLGVDARAGAEFMTAVNRLYGLRERSVVLHDHPDLTALAAHLAAA
ncbi:acyl carrier protein [Streptomyces sp. NPDC097595]|uniref:acyl carrier protein n=1 Tax=Streptomyces sp. NPDC097595 TaxID=3366090 RepID=UPI003820BE9D